MPTKSPGSEDPGYRPCVGARHAMPAHACSSLTGVAHRFRTFVLHQQSKTEFAQFTQFHFCIRVIWTAKPAKSFAKAAASYIVTLCLASTTDAYPVALLLRSTRANPSECAHPKNVSASLLECALAKSLDLNPPRMNSYKKSRGVPLRLPFIFLLLRFASLPPALRKPPHSKLRQECVIITGSTGSRKGYPPR